MDVGYLTLCPRPSISLAWFAQPHRLVSTLEMTYLLGKQRSDAAPDGRARYHADPSDDEESDADQ